MPTTVQQTPFDGSDSPLFDDPIEESTSSRIIYTLDPYQANPNLFVGKLVSAITIASNNDDLQSQTPDEEEEQHHKLFDHEYYDDEGEYTYVPFTSNVWQKKNNGYDSSNLNDIAEFISDKKDRINDELGDLLYERHIFCLSNSHNILQPGTPQHSTHHASWYNATAFPTVNVNNTTPHHINARKKAIIKKKEKQKMHANKHLKRNDHIIRKITKTKTITTPNRILYRCYLLLVVVMISLIGLTSSTFDNTNELQQHPNNTNVDNFTYSYLPNQDPIPSTPEARGLVNSGGGNGGGGGDDGGYGGGNGGSNGGVVSNQFQLAGYNYDLLQLAQQVSAHCCGGVGPRN